MSRELDIEVAEKIFGFQWMVTESMPDRFLVGPDETYFLAQAGCKPAPIDSPIAYRPYETVPHFSTDIAAAWTVVEHMAKDGWYYEILNSGDEVYVIFCQDPEDPYSGSASTASEAICKAAIAALTPAPRDHQ
jgi:hypothetical protein